MRVKTGSKSTNRLLFTGRAPEDEQIDEEDEIVFLQTSKRVNGVHKDDSQSEG